MIETEINKARIKFLIKSIKRFKSENKSGVYDLLIASRQRELDKLLEECQKITKDLK